MGPVHCQPEDGHNIRGLKNISAIVIVRESDKLLHQVHSLVETRANTGGLGTISGRNKLLLENGFQSSGAKAERCQLAV